MNSGASDPDTTKADSGGQLPVRPNPAAPTSACVLTDSELALLGGVFDRHPEITGVVLFGSRAKGTATPSSDVDLALEGIADPLQAEAIASELDELPLPYRFDVKALDAIRHQPLRDHITRVGLKFRG